MAKVFVAGEVRLRGHSGRRRGRRTCSSLAACRKRGKDERGNGNAARYDSERSKTHADSIHGKRRLSPIPIGSDRNFFLQSQRSATIGSTLLARRAGSHAASSVIPLTTAMATVNVSGSRALNPNSCSLI